MPLTIQKCPKCEQMISEIVASPVKAKDGSNTLKAAVYTCPRCHTILSAGPDPYALAQEVARLVRHPRRD
jgi:uncharacterized protein with PIN domain